MSLELVNKKDCRPKRRIDGTRIGKHKIIKIENKSDTKSIDKSIKNEIDYEKIVYINRLTEKYDEKMIA